MNKGGRTPWLKENGKGFTARVVRIQVRPRPEPEAHFERLRFGSQWSDSKLDSSFLAPRLP